MGEKGPEFRNSPLRILTITQGKWGERIAEYIQTNAPSNWTVENWAAPRILPLIVDDPEDFLPEALPEVDLVIPLGEVSGLAQLVPDIVKVCKADSVLAPIDRNESLPAGLVGQLKGWLEAMEVAVVFPKPFCSLTENTINYGRLIEPYDDPIIRQFASMFGKPELDITVEEGRISEAKVVRDSACGCTSYVAEYLVGTPVEDALEKSGMLHHHFPCLASMNQDETYLDTLMHVSGNILKDTVKEEIDTHLTVVYLRPQGRSEAAE